jgi:hypothetical protein
MLELFTSWRLVDSGVFEQSGTRSTDRLVLVL